ncbi:hypothetical protein [Clostridium sp. DL1XJH146]
MLNSVSYKEKLKDSLDAYFNVDLDKEVYNKKFDLYASFNQRNAKYMLVKNAEIYAFKTDEYVFYEHFEETLKISDIETIKEFIESNINEMVHVDKEHMSSIFNFIITVDNGIDDETLKAIKKFKFHKSFKFGLNGWSDVRLMVIDLEKDELYSNRFAKKEGKRFLFQN